MAGLLAWCVGDFVFVRFRPPPVFEATLLMFPVAVGLVARAAFSHVEPGGRFMLVLAAVVLACGVAVVLVLLVGIPFHFWIGGRL